MRSEPLGDSALLLSELDRPAFEAAAAIERAGIRGVIEAVASFDTVAIYFDPQHFSPTLLEELPLGLGIGDSALHEIPVCYSLGEDMETVAEFLGLSADFVITQHTAHSYRCFAVGFCPGFPYLGYLADEISGVPRLPSPRLRVPPGAVAVTGRQTGVYPIERPGGWRIVGHTPLCLVDVEERYFPIKAGDTVRFVSISKTDYDALKGERL